MAAGNTDTIAAIATGSGRAGVGIVRISGPTVPEISRQITSTTLVNRKATYLPFLDKDSSALDEGVAIFFAAPHSFTGEHVLELHGHGGPVILDMLLARVLSMGARIARPGEFSERAFLNGKMDLAQAEAISDLISSSSQAAARAAVRSLSGDFSAHIQRINTELIALRVWLEAALDFSEEEIDFLAQPELRQRTSELLAQFDLLLARAEQGQRLRDGLSVVIAGATNAGKSSLLNRLAGNETAIVTDIAGTTRDTLHTDITLSGVPLHIVDTAGIRNTPDHVEQLGIERARKAVQEADHVLIIVDAANPVLPELPSIEKKGMSVIFNKIDLSDNREDLNALIARLAPELPEDAMISESLSISAKTGEGMDVLEQHLLQLAGYNEQVEGVYSARRRHVDALIQARQNTDNALSMLEVSQMPELAAEELKLAQGSLEAITGRFDADELLGEIFSSFCVGK